MVTLTPTDGQVRQVTYSPILSAEEVHHKHLPVAEIPSAYLVAASQTVKLGPCPCNWQVHGLLHAVPR